MLKRFLACLVFCLTGLYLFAQENGLPVMLNSLSTARETFEVYLDRADLERDREEWLTAAGYGLQVIKAEWESRALILKNAGITDCPAAGDLSEELDRVLRERLSDWLAQRFLESSVRPDLSGLFSAIGEANLALLYETGPEGTILKDQAGDPVMKGEEGFSGDRDLWKTRVTARAGEILKTWEERVLMPPPELAAVSNQRDDETFASACGLSFNTCREGFRRELAVLFLAGESRFAGKRLKDSFSLRKKTEAGTASSVTASLIEEMSTGLEKSLDNLRAGLEAPTAPDNAEGIVIDPASWRESFRREFDRGLELFRRTEETLLAERVRWEQEAGRSFRETEEAWSGAYARLMEAKKLWEKDLNRLLENGEAQWTRKEDELAAAIGEARRELERSVSEQAGSMSNRVNSLVDMFAQSRAVMGTAQTTGEYWAERLPAVPGMQPVRFNTDECRNLMDNLLCSYIDEYRSSSTRAIETDLSRYGEEAEELAEKIALETNPETRGKLSGQLDALLARSAALEREKQLLSLAGEFARQSLTILQGDYGENPSVEDWLAAFAAFSEDTVRAGRMNMLSPAELETVKDLGSGFFTQALARAAGNTALSETLYWQEVFDTYRDYAAAAEKELAETCGLALTGIAGENPSLPWMEILSGSWEGVFLSDYQIELIKARSLESYWEKQVDLARTVYDYAADDSSGRKTEAETGKDYEEAFSACVLAQEIYEQAVRSLEARGDELTASRQALDGARQELLALQQRLEDNRSAYQAAFDLYTTQNPDYFREKLADSCRGLMDLLGFSAEPETESREQLLANYLAAARDFGMEGSMEAAVRELKRLVNGDPDNPMVPPLSRLQEAARKAAAWDFDITAGRDVFLNDLSNCLGIGDNQQEKDELLDAFTREFDAIQAGKEQDGNNLAWYYEVRIRAMAEQIVSRTAAELDERISAIAIMHAPGPAWWLERETGLTRKDFTFTECAEIMKARALEAEKDYWTGLADLERAALNLLRDMLVSQGQEVLGDLDPADLADGAQTGNRVRSLAFALYVYSKKNGISINLEHVNSVAGSLDAILAVFSAPENDGLAMSALAEDFRRLGESDPYTLDFFSGRGTFIMEGLDLARLLLSEEARTARRAGEGCRLLNSYAGLSPGLRKQAAADAARALADTFVSSGIASPGTSLIPDFCDPAGLFERDGLWKNKTRTDIAGILADMNGTLVRAENVLPAYVLQTASAYLDSLREFAALHFSRPLTGAAAEADLDLAEAGLLDMRTWSAEVKEASDALASGTLLTRIFAAFGIIQSGSTERPVGGVPRFTGRTALDLGAESEQLVKTLCAFAGTGLARAVLTKAGDDRDVSSLDWETELTSMLSGLGLDTGAFGFTDAIITQAQLLFRQADILLVDGDAKAWNFRQDFRSFTSEEEELFIEALWNTLPPLTVTDIYSGIADSGIPAVSLFTAAEAFYTFDRLYFPDRPVTAEEADTLFEEFLTGLSAEPDSVIALAADFRWLLMAPDRAGRKAALAELLGLSALHPAAAGLPADTPGREAYSRALFIHALDDLTGRGGYEKEEALKAATFLGELSGLRPEEDTLSLWEVFTAGDKTDSVPGIRYLPLLDGSVYDYAVKLAAGSIAAAGSITAAGNGLFQAARYAVSLLDAQTGALLSGSLSDSLSLLSVNPETEASIIVELVRRLLVDEAASASDEIISLEEICSFYEALRGFTFSRENDDRNYRAYLVPDLIGSTGASKAVCPVTDSTTDDRSLALTEGDGTGNGRIAVIRTNGAPAPWQGSAELEACNNLFGAQLDLAAAFTRLSEDEKQPLSAYDSILGSAGLLAGFEPATGGYNPYYAAVFNTVYSSEPETEQIFTEAEKQLAAAGARTNYHKQTIVSLGRALEAFNRDRDAMMTGIIIPLAAETDALENRYRDAQKAWQTAAEFFSGVNEDYAAQYDIVKTAETASEEARHLFQKAEAVFEYASTGYLGLPEAESTETGGSGYLMSTVNPEARLAEANSRLLLAQAAFQALAGLYPEGRPGDFAADENNEAYRQAYEEYALHFENSLKLKRINSLVNNALSIQQGKVEAAENKVRDRITAIFSTDILNEGSAVYRTDAEIESWMRSVKSQAASKGTGLFDQWGIALWWEKNMNNPEEAAKALAGGGNLAAEKSGIEFAGYLTDSFEHIYNRTAASGDYVFYKTLYEEGGILYGEFFQQQAKYEVNGYLYERFATDRAAYLTAQKTADDAAIGFLGTAIALSFFPPLAAPFYAAAAAMGLVAGGYKMKAEDCEAGMQESGGLKEGALSLMASEKDSILTSVNYYLFFKNELERERGILAAMKLARQDAATVTADELMNAVLQAASVTASDAGEVIGLPGADSNSIRSALFNLFSGSGYSESLAEDQKKDSAGMLASLIKKAEAEKSRSEKQFADETGLLSALQKRTLADFRRQTQEVLSGEGPATPEVLADAAALGFDPRLFSSLYHLDRMRRLFTSLAALADSAEYTELAVPEKELALHTGEIFMDLLSERLTGFMKVKEAQWESMTADTAYKKDCWVKTITAVAEEGRNQWKEGLRQLETRRNKWMEDYASEYITRTELWDAGYLNLIEDRNLWAEDAAVKAARTGSTAMLAELGLNADVSVRRVNSILIPDMKTSRADPETLVTDLLGNACFSSLLQKGAIAGRGIDSINTTLYASLGADKALSSGMLKAITAWQGSSIESMEEHIALLTADQARQATAGAIKGLQEAVKEANLSVEQSVDVMLLGEGFGKSRNGYSREALIDNTVLSGNQYETQIIEGYEKFECPDLVLGVDLSFTTLSHLSPAGIEAQVNRAMGELEKLQITIFGNPGLKETGGEFGKHAGKEAVMAEEANHDKSMKENIKDPGSGQLGRITSLFFHYLIREGRGWQEFGKPDYDKRLWDDDGRFFKAPTLRGLADIGVSILANILVPGSGLGTVLAAGVLSLADDVVFAGLDVDNGLVDSKDAILGLGKKALTSAAASFINAGAGALQTGSDLLGSLARTGLNTAAGFAANCTGGFINSWNLDGNGRLAFDPNVFTESILGSGALTGYAAGAAGSLTGGLLTGSTEGLSSKLSSGIGSVAGFMGSGVQTAVEYALTGEASLNLLNVRDLAQVFGAGAFGIQGTGILELSLNRDKGLSMKTGMGGMDLSMSRMTDVVRSAGDWVKQQGIRLFDIFGSTDFAANYRGSKRAGTMLRANWAFGDAQAVKQVDDILIGETRLKAGYLGEGAETSLAEDGVRTVSLSSFGGQGDFDSRLLAGVILQHEAYRDGAADTDRRQYVETLNAVGAHTLMALSMAEEYGSSFILNNDTLRADAGALWSGFQSFANYTGQAYDRSGDYWRLTREGQLLYDGKADLFGEDGKLVLQDVNAKGVEGGLLEILGIDSSDRQAVEELRLQLVSAGLTYGVMDGADESESDNWYWNLGKNNQANMNRGIDAPAVLLDDLAFTGRFEEEDLYKVLLNRGEIPLSRTVTDNIGSFGYKFRALFSEDWADSWAVKKDGTRKMDYAEWRAFREGEYVKELLRTDLSISEDLLPAIPLIRPDERLAEMKGVIIHWTESTWGSSAQDTRDWFADQKIMASAHYSIGQDGEIIRMVPEDYIAWASGGVKPSALSGELFSGNPNNYTVSIESNPSYDRISFDENGLNISPGFLSRVNYDAMVKLTADILSRNNLSSSDLWRHYDMTGKDCPRYMQPDIFNRQGERIYNREWQDFRYRVQLLIDSIK